MNYFRKFLKESPQSIDDITMKRAKKYFDSEFNDLNITVDDFEDIGDDIKMCLIDEFGEHRFLMYKDMEALCELKSVIIKNSNGTVKAYEEIYISKIKPFTKNNKGALKLMYSKFSKLLDTYIISGEKQTDKNKKIWKSFWYSKKYKMFGYDILNKKYINFPTLENYWCIEDKCKDRRLAIKF